MLQRFPSTLRYQDRSEPLQQLRNAVNRFGLRRSYPTSIMGTGPLVDSKSTRLNLHRSRFHDRVWLRFIPKKKLTPAYLVLRTGFAPVTQ
jgi:hypothetical protein